MPSYGFHIGRNVKNSNFIVLVFGKLCLLQGKAACLKSKKLSVEVQTADSKFDGKLDVQPAGCGP